ncbi:hypothetical protein HMPREF0293_1362 [Corynebacterium glucuronolyticum ATCC 51866]|uniref:MFS transporter n=1 Tax=Corynebacterium glucuronolyticum ATCC 51866 TaxID=548478 RepID=A0ABM9XPR3_9CORY|nr:hypothetical protein HMPREF0293_1362 [Corynebacterium glucuronolyticum ATCC 51866]
MFVRALSTSLAAVFAATPAGTCLDRLATPRARRLLSGCFGLFHV